MIRCFVFLVPCIIYLADIGKLSYFSRTRRTLILSFLIAAAILFILQSTRPGGPGNGPAIGVINMTPIFTIISVVLNLVLSGSIVLRLLFFRQRIRRDLGSAAGRQYISIATMLIESAMIYTLVWICSVVPTQLRNPLGNVFTPPSVHVQVCSSLTTPIN
jgi:hypothetical protein